MRRVFAGPLRLAVAATFWGADAPTQWGTKVAGRVLTFDDDPMPNEQFTVIHDWRAPDEGWVRTTVPDVAPDADGAYSAALPGKGRHVLTLLHKGQSARRHIHVTRSGVGIDHADLPLRNASWGGRQPSDLSHLRRRAGVPGAVRFLPAKERADGRADG
jgi:hypothetical protein